ncbi:MAG: galactokinase [Planctomycetes bacterium]|nr:galactokinase [Planctomycetota bacterium]
MMDTAVISDSFEQRFGRRPGVLARAPGRVNIIGEHTDYNAGLVLPFAIRQSIQIAAAAAGSEITAHSLGQAQTAAFPTTVEEPSQENTWQNYLRGVCCGLRRRGVAVRGAELLIGGDLPIGGGVSSSAALCVAAALALLKLTGTELSKLEIAKLAQEAEHHFAGTPCGIMDPYVSLFGRAGHALRLDCRDNTHECQPIELGPAQFVLIDSGVAHELSSGVYEQRVRECQAAASAIRECEPAVRTLRDVTPRMLEAHSHALDPVLRKRARHVVTENVRVDQARQALADGRVDDLGRLISASHRSLRDDYEVSCPEVDELVAALEAAEGVFGARMVGGGGGGMVLALVGDDAVADLPRELESRLGRKRPSPRLLALHPADGAECAAC